VSRIAIVIATALAFAAMFSAAPAQAQRVFVSATGSDANPCSFASPCRGFQHAHDVAPTHGEIDVLDPAGYGSVTITKSISIQGHGFSGISVSSGATGITINAGPSDSVTLNGLIIDGAHAGYDGIVFNSGGTLTVVDCVVQNFVQNGGQFNTGDGILIQPMAGAVKFNVINTTALSNAFVGIYYLPASGGTATAIGAIDHVVAGDNQYGILLNTSFASGGGIVATISNSVTTGNSAAGLWFQANISASQSASVDNVSINGSNVGIYGNGTPSVLLGRSVITGNVTFGVNNNTNPNTFYTYGDNRINLNGTDVGGPMPTLITTFKPQ
jgi:hypothetical protein